MAPLFNKWYGWIKKKSAVDLAIKSSKDFKIYEFTCEIESFKFEVTTLIQSIETPFPLNILPTLPDFGLTESYPNINVAHRIFLTLPVSIASCKGCLEKKNQTVEIHTFIKGLSPSKVKGKKTKFSNMLCFLEFWTVSPMQDSKPTT